ncbi:MAG: rhodanese-like domain-containing protein [Acidobacteriota bacterium]
MNFKQFYLGCLAHASYYVGSENEAVIIDPQRDVQQYLDEASTNEQSIKYVIETHSHADFVSGHTELAAKTGAQIVYGSRAHTAFPTLKVSDGDELWIGTVKLKFIETPGHTPESITIIASDSEDVDSPQKMFTGDTLFCGDVGRPDLIGSKGFTSEEMGGMLYDSLREKILKFSDDTEIYPAHGAGSLCGKSLSSETWSTLGAQKATNYALKPMGKDEFVKLVAADQPRVPAYFPRSAEQNLAGPASIEDLPRPRRMSSDEAAKFDGVILDVRPAAEFGAGHIPNAINIGLSGKFATWAGTFITVGTSLAIAAGTEEQLDEGFLRLARVGLETVTAFVLMDDYISGEKTIEQVSAAKASELIQKVRASQFVDVRQPGEFAAGHAVGATNLPLNSLTENIEKLDPRLPTYVICQTGYRSSLATSLLENAGFEAVYNVSGGTADWIKSELPTKTERISIPA